MKFCEEKNRRFRIREKHVMNSLLGLFMLEQMLHSPDGVLLTRGPGSYKLPGKNWGQSFTKSHSELLAASILQNIFQIFPSRLPGQSKIHPVML